MKMASPKHYWMSPNLTGRLANGTGEKERDISLGQLLAPRARA